MLTLSFDFFTNQDQTFPTVWELAGHGIYPRTKTYIPFQAGVLASGSIVIGPESRMIAALLPFFVGQDTVESQLVSCPTERCTWEPINALSISGSCNAVPDSSLRLEFACYNSVGDWLPSSHWSHQNQETIRSCG